MEVRMQLQARDETGDLAARTYTFVNRNYLGAISTPYSSTPPAEPPTVGAVELPPGYSTFWAWTKAVARGMASLSASILVDAIVVASWSANEEEAGG